MGSDQVAAAARSPATLSLKTKPRQKFIVRKKKPSAKLIASDVLRYPPFMEMLRKVASISKIDLRNLIGSIKSCLSFGAHEGLPWVGTEISRDSLAWTITEGIVGFAVLGLLLLVLATPALSDWLGSH